MGHENQQSAAGDDRSLEFSLYGQNLGVPGAALPGLSGFNATLAELGFSPGRVGHADMGAHMMPDGVLHGRTLVDRQAGVLGGPGAPGLGPAVQWMQGPARSLETQLRARPSHGAVERNRRIAEAQDLQSIMLLCMREAEHFNQVNRATAVNRLGKMLGEGRASTGAMEAALRWMLWLTSEAVKERGLGDRTLGLRGISNMLHAFGRTSTQIRTPGLIRGVDMLACAIAEMPPQEIAQCNAQDVSNTLWALAKVGLTPRPGVLELLVQAALMPRVLSEASPQAVCNIVWAMGTLQHHPGDHALATLVAAASSPPALSCIKSQEISNLLWGVAVLCQRGAALPHLAPVLNEALSPRKLAASDAQAICNVTWALSVLGVRPTDAELGAMTAEAANRRKLQRASTSDLSRLLLACARMSFRPHASVMDAIVDAAFSETGLSRTSPRDLSLLLWAVAVLEGRPSEAGLARAMGIACQERMLLATQHGELCDMLWAAARFGHTPSAPDLARLCAVLFSDSALAAAGAPQLSAALWACAALSHNPGEHAVACAYARLTEPTTVSGLPGQDLAHCLWGGALLLPPGATASDGSAHGEANQAVVNAWWSAALRRANAVDAALWPARSLRLVAEALPLLPAELVAAELSEEFVARCEACWEAEAGAQSVAEATETRAMLARVCGAALQAAGMSDAFDVAVAHVDRTRAPARTVDVALLGRAGSKAGAVKLAVVGDPPSSFVTGASGSAAGTGAVRLHGSMLARDRDLQRRGWHVVSVPVRWPGAEASLLASLCVGKALTGAQTDGAAAAAMVEEHFPPQVVPSVVAPPVPMPRRVFSSDPSSSSWLPVMHRRPQLSSGFMASSMHTSDHTLRLSVGGTRAHTPLEKLMQQRLTLDGIGERDDDEAASAGPSDHGAHAGARTDSGNLAAMGLPALSPAVSAGGLGLREAQPLPGGTFVDPRSVSAAGSAATLQLSGTGAFGFGERGLSSHSGWSQHGDVWGVMGAPAALGNASSAGLPKDISPVRLARRGATTTGWEHETTQVQDRVPTVREEGSGVADAAGDAPPP